MNCSEKTRLDSTLLTREQFAAYLGISLSTLNRLIKNGEVNPIRFGKFIRFDKANALAESIPPAITSK